MFSFVFHLACVGVAINMTSHTHFVIWLGQNIIWLLILRKILFDFSVLANAECKIK